MLRPKHGDAHVSIGEIEYLAADAIDFVTKDDADRKAWLPIEEVHRVWARFYRCDFEASHPQLSHCGYGIPMVFPWDSCFGAQRSFADFGVRRHAGDARQYEAFDTGAVGGAKEGAHIEKAADIVE